MSTNVPTPPPEGAVKPDPPPAPPALRRPRTEAEWDGEITALELKERERSQRLECLGLAVRLMERSTAYGSGRGRAEETTNAAETFLEWLKNDTEGEE